MSCCPHPKGTRPYLGDTDARQGLHGSRQAGDDVQDLSGQPRHPNVPGATRHQCHAARPQQRLCHRLRHLPRAPQIPPMSPQNPPGAARCPRVSPQNMPQHLHILPQNLLCCFSVSKWPHFTPKPPGTQNTPWGPPKLPPPQQGTPNPWGDPEVSLGTPKCLMKRPPGTPRSSQGHPQTVLTASGEPRSWGGSPNYPWGPPKCPLKIPRYPMGTQVPPRDLQIP